MDDVSTPAPARPKPTPPRSREPKRPRKWLNATEVAERLEVSRPKLMRMREEGTAPPYRMIGNTPRWYPDELEAWFEQQTIRPGDAPPPIKQHRHRVTPATPRRGGNHN